MRITPTCTHELCCELHFSQDEIHPELRFTGAGILAMANSGPNTNGKLSSDAFSLYTLRCNSNPTGSQFFLTLGPTPYLDNKHTIFGRVSSGMRVVQRLGAVAVDAQDRSVRLLAFLSLLQRLTMSVMLGPRKMSKYTRLAPSNPVHRATLLGPFLGYRSSYPVS